MYCSEEALNDAILSSDLYRYRRFYSYIVPHKNYILSKK